MSTHVMIDLETLSTETNAVIIALGAVKFDPEAEGIQSGFYLRIDADGQPQIFDRHMDPKTVMWWMSASQDDARKALLSTDAIDLPSALSGFDEWFGLESMPVWGNGATFDNMILRSAYGAIGSEAPWNFRHDRCFRTFKALADVEGPPMAEGVEHNALDDAIHQARWMRHIVEHLGIGEPS